MLLWFKATVRLAVSMVSPASLRLCCSSCSGHQACWPGTRSRCKESRCTRPQNLTCDQDRVLDHRTDAAAPLFRNKSGQKGEKRASGRVASWLAVTFAALFRNTWAFCAACTVEVRGGLNVSRVDQRDHRGERGRRQRQRRSWGSAVDRPARPCPPSSTGTNVVEIPLGITAPAPFSSVLPALSLRGLRSSASDPDDDVAAAPSRRTNASVNPTPKMEKNV